MFKLLKDGFVLKKLMVWPLVDAVLDSLMGWLSGHESRYPRRCFRCETLVRFGSIQIPLGWSTTEDGKRSCMPKLLKIQDSSLPGALVFVGSVFCWN